MKSPVIVGVMHRWMRHAWSLVLDLLFLVSFWGLFFWPLLGRREYLVLYDLIDQHDLFRAFFHRALVDGESACWAPSFSAAIPSSLIH